MIHSDAQIIPCSILSEFFGDTEEFAMPCGGTHVKCLNDIGTLRIRKVKQDKDHERVAYEVA